MNAPPSEVARGSIGYAAYLPKEIPRAAVISFSVSFGLSLGIAAMGGANKASIISGAFIAGAFGAVASLVDSTIRPLLHLWKIGHVGRDERAFDIIGRTIIVLGLTGSVFLALGAQLSPKLFGEAVIGAVILNLVGYCSGRVIDSGRARSYVASVYHPGRIT